VNITSPQQWSQRALLAAQGGDSDGARRLLASGLAEYPLEAALWNAAGHLLLKLGDTGAAATHFGKAAELKQSSAEFAINHAIALSSADRPVEALAALAPFDNKSDGSALYCSTRGNAERSAGNSAKAAEWYDRALSIEPGRLKALHGRARVAIERGETDALDWFDRALALNPGDADLWLGKAQALDVIGDTAGARQIANSLVEQAPGWTEGLRFLAQLRLVAREDDFTSHYGEAAKKVPQDPNILSAWCATLASLDYYERAAQIAAAARRAFPDLEYFAFLEAAHASTGGQLARAEAIFGEIDKNDDDRWLQEARHRIRSGEYDHAEVLLDKVSKVDPWNISAWALRGVVWRLTNDPRSEWLQEQEGLVRLVPLCGAETILPKVIPLLHQLHDQSPFPLGQSLRGGTQTRGNLFDRTEVVLTELREAIMGTVADYRTTLPPQDDTHPLLRTREAQWGMAGSWSVRLAGGGDFHASHIHPQGIVSSALYLELPKHRGTDTQAGWLEVGSPAKDLGVDLGPLKTIEPKEGHLALFPSTLYHGTLPFGGGRRMTVAFDVNLLHAQSL